MVLFFFRWWILILILAAHAALLEHVHDTPPGDPDPRPRHAAQTVGCTPEKATSEFTASSPSSHRQPPRGLFGHDLGPDMWHDLGPDNWSK